jgi:hypothetical protein
VAAAAVSLIDIETYEHPTSNIERPNSLKPQKEVNTMKTKQTLITILLISLALVLVSPAVMAADPIKIGIMQGISGPYEIYAKAEVTGFKMGLEYFTKGSNQIIGRDVKIIVEDTQVLPWPCFPWLKNSRRFLSWNLLWRIPLPANIGTDIYFARVAIRVRMLSPMP